MIFCEELSGAMNIDEHDPTGSYRILVHGAWNKEIDPKGAGIMNLSMQKLVIMIL